MVRVLITGNLKVLTGGESVLEMEVATIRQLFLQLGERFPALATPIEEGLAVAIDGQIYQDAWLQPIPEDAEVALLPAIGGG